MNRCRGVLEVDRVSMSSFGVGIHNTFPIVRQR